MVKSPPTLTNEECSKLLEELLQKNGTLNQGRRGIRNHCMAALMLDAGLRVGEVVQLYKDNLYYQNEPVHHLLVTEAIAKNHRERSVPLSRRIRNTINAMQFAVWIEFPHYVDSRAFYQLDPGQPITTRQVERFLRKAAMKSLGRPVHPHILRHTFASRLMRTVNVRIVQELLGHQHLSTTQIYMHPNREDLTKAIDTIQTCSLADEIDKNPLPPSSYIPDRPDTTNTDRDMT